MAGLIKIGSGVLGGIPVGFYRGKYAVKPFNLAITTECEDGHPKHFADISINLGVHLPEDEFVVNHDVQQFEDELMATDLFEDTGKRVNYGYVRQRPIWRLK